ncbi:endoribonuclease Dicer-like isoform X2 [Lineus longissimus]
MALRNPDPAPVRRTRSHRQEAVPTAFFTPRTYQIELLDVALQRNTIVCLGTGTGKTFIAIMLIKELAHQVRTPYNSGGKRTVFLVNNTDLVAQQAKAIRHHTELAVGEYIGAMNVDIWDLTRWQKELQKYQVLVMTHQIFLDLLLHSFVKTSQINLMIFDECHHAAERHPYAQIMEHYVQEKKLLPEFNSKLNRLSLQGPDYVESLQIADSKCNSPAILGLTASILNRKCKSVRQLIQDLQSLEKTLHSTAITASDMVSGDSFGAKPKEQLEVCDDYDEDQTDIVEKMEKELQDSLQFLDACSLRVKYLMEKDDDDEHEIYKGLTLSRTAIIECQVILHTLGPWCAYNIAQALIKQLAKLEDHEPLDSNRLFLRFALTNLRIVYRLFDKEFDKVQCLEDFHKYISPRVLKLIDIIHLFKPNDDFEITMDGENDFNFDDLEEGEMSEDSFDLSDDEETPAVQEQPKSPQQMMHYVAKKKPNEENESSAHNGHVREVDEAMLGIVFVERRNVALTLNKLIQELCNWDENLYFVRSAHIMGRGTKGVTKESEALHKKQEETLRRFRNKDVNLLIATSVLEEGIDVPKCNLVTMFDKPQNYRSYVQSKGRARAMKSKYFMLVNKKEEEIFEKEVANYKEMEKTLVTKCRGREELDEEEMDNHLADKYLPPYMPIKKEGTAKVTMSSAIGLVNRYCAKLPSDAFTHLTPKCTTREIDGAKPEERYQATLQLPINSPIKCPIIGEAMPRKKLAQMAVALKTCEILHKEGELDDHLLPVGKEVLEFEGDDEEWENEDLQGQTRPGTTKRKQYYYKKNADHFVRNRPKPQEPCHLYFVKMVLTNPISEEQNTRGRQLYPPEETVQSFGIVTTKKLPKIPLFPVFTRSGEVTISLELLTDELDLADVQLSKLSDFHRYVFLKMLRLEKDPMVYDPVNAECGYLVVPLNKDSPEEDLGIDWKFVDLIQSCMNLNSNAAFQKEKEDKFTFDEEKFRDAVVMPSYRNIDKPQYFYVAEIRYDLNPSSSFPSQELYSTFELYYKQKYGIAITSHDQPLLDVDHTSARLNLLTPRYMNQKGVALPTSSAQTKRAKRENLQQKQIFIPELCGIHPFPASLWRKAVCIPAILYRVNYLLVADEIRLRIAHEAKIGVDVLPEGFEFPKLDFGFSTRPQNPEDQSKSDAADLSNTSFESMQSDGPDPSPEQNGHSGDHPTDEMVDNNAAEGGSLSKEKEGNTRDTSLDISSADSTTDSQSCDQNNEPADAMGSCDQKHQAADVTSLQNGTNENNEHDGVVEIVNGHRPIEEQNGDENHVVVVEKNGQTASEDDDNVHTTEKQETNQDTAPNHDRIIENGNTIDSTDCDFVPRLTSPDYQSEFGPSPCLILQTLTMSNANDFFNLERLETIGDSFLKFAITAYLYCSYPGIHEGKLSYLRSKQVSNFNLYRLGKKKAFAECMVSAKFEPTENWLPPGYVVRGDPRVVVQVSDRRESPRERRERKKSESLNLANLSEAALQQRQLQKELDEIIEQSERDKKEGTDVDDILIPYNLQTQQSLPDKSIADCVEALIGCYLMTCGMKAALQFMSWLGLKVLPKEEVPKPEHPGETVVEYHDLPPPASPLLTHVPHALRILEHNLNGFESFEEKIQYKFQDRSYLLQAFTHASYHYNNITDCYQRLEFLGDAILDYVITRHLFEDSKKHSPGVLTDLRSALVNNNIFAALAVKWDFHKFFKAVSPHLFHVIQKFVEWQKDKKNDEINLDEEFQESEGDAEGEDIEIPKALGDIFESVAGAIYLDSGMSLEAVWKVYYRMMRPQIEMFTTNIPKSPVRELLEMEPEAAKFEKPERTMDGKIRVTVNVIGKGQFIGIGRNYRIAKSAAAKRALKALKQMRMQILEQQMIQLEKMMMLEDSLTAA